ncbi:MAG: short-chain fatty acid transporter [Bacteroidetes bacterium GWA2_31_9]|nr:MAG: short-chain fatty acid transporter [Bacteroidetes bacterium GWA2_31_9]
MLKKIPHTFVIVFLIIIVAAIATWFVPAGEFERTIKVLPDGSERNVVIQGSYHAVENQPQIWQILSAFLDGFRKQAEIIIFILIIGGAFWIMNSSKAIDVGIMSFLRRTRKLEKLKIFNKLGINNIIMILIMTMFSIFGAIFGMSEETIAFVIILVPLSISMGYDSIVGVCLVYVAAHLGFAGAVLNPFTIGIAQGLSDIPIFSGIEYRIICWIIINFVGFAFILWYASKVKKNPKFSPMYEADEYWRTQKLDESTDFKYYTPISAWVSYFLTIIAMVLFSISHKESTITIGSSSFTTPIIPILTGIFAITGFLGLRKSVHFFILNLLAFTILYLIVGVMGYGWYVTEIGTLFLALGILSGIAINKSANDITKLFLEGVKDILSAALVVGLAGGIIVILTEGKIIDTIMNSLSGSMENMGKTGTIGIMYTIQTFLNIIIPSGSAKAALTMPIMAPFSDMIGISRQATVLAFQFGDGFTNMITPTSGVLIAATGVAKIPYQVWFKWVLPLIIILFVLGFLLLIPTVTMTLNGF